MVDQHRSSEPDAAPERPTGEDDARQPPDAAKPTLANTQLRYLECLSGITSQLLAAVEPWPLLPGIVAWLQQSAGVDRCYFFECRRSEHGAWLASQRFESVRAGIQRHRAGLLFADSDLAAIGLDRWADVLSSGNEILGHMRDLPAAERAALVSEGVSQILLMPVIVDDVWVGCVGFDLCEVAAQLGHQEAALLRAAANTIGAALERVSSERATQKTHSLLASIIRAAQDYAIIAVDLKFRVLHYSAVAEEIFGYSEQEVIGKTLQELDLLETSDEDIAGSFVAAVIDEGVYRTESEVRDPHGDYRTLEIAVNPMQDERGSPTGYLLIARDVTELRKEQRRSLQSQRMESVGLLAGGIAHDFNNILMGILGYASLAKDQIGPDHPVIRMLSIIEQSGERAAGLTNELLAYARGGKYQSLALRIDEQVSELLNILATNLPKNVRIERDFAPELPFILADPVQIQQVIMNICLNAGEAIKDKQAQEGGEEPEGLILISTAAVGLDGAALVRHDVADEVTPGKFVLLSIKDNGCGMDEETLARIFEPFFTTKFTGRGLGLSAVDGIIRNHGGFMVVDSTPGEGSQFSIYLPACTMMDIDTAEEPMAALEGAETILFIDDEEIVRQLALLTMTNLGYQVLLASSGREGVDVFGEHRDEISLIVLDLTMPGMSGESTIQALRKVDSRMPILLTSGYDETTARDSAGEENGTGFLQKPYTPEALSRAVRSMLDTFRTARPD